MFVLEMAFQLTKRHFCDMGGFIVLQVYTGNGKGKTTAAIGLVVRALGAGLHVYMMQFMKSLSYSEQRVLQGFSPQLKLKTTGKPFFVAKQGMLSPAEQKAWGTKVVVFPPGKPPANYVHLMQKSVKEAALATVTGKYDILVLDEINVALFYGLLLQKDVEALLRTVPGATEIIMTGRAAPDWLIEKADLVTEMKEIKHYYTKGISARKGIEN